MHGYGKSGDTADWYIALTINDNEYVNVAADMPPDANGFFTYLVDTATCTASDFQYFDTYTDSSAGANFVAYIQTLSRGICFCNYVSRPK